MSQCVCDTQLGRNNISECRRGAMHAEVIKLIPFEVYVCVCVCVDVVDVTMMKKRARTRTP